MPSGNFSYVIDSSFQPFSMQEMLVPFSAYKDAYEKSEEQYNDLSDKSDKFKYLSETLPEGSKARKLYEGYANDLAKQAEDLAHNGLSMSNRRALTSMRRRYQGEIGRLLQADEAMREEKKLRRSLSAQDSSMLYAIDNLDIDSFLDGETPNLYNISGNELYTRGAAAGKAASSRVFSAGDAGSTLNGYYRDYVQKMGYNRDTIQKFYQDMSTIPELQMAADAILEEKGVNQNLTGNNLQRARQSVINGMIDGAIYQENHNPTRDLGVLTPMEQNQIAMQKEQLNLEKQKLALSMLAAQTKANKNNSGSGSQKYAGYDKLTYVSDGGNHSKYVDEISNNATPIKIDVKNDRYVAYVNVDGKDVEIGSIDTKGNFKTSTNRNNNFGKAFDKKMSWYQIGPTYDREYDDNNIRAMLQDVVNTAKREGENAFRNYNYYFEPDNVGWSNDGGGFYREPMARVAGTVSNEDPAIYESGVYDEVPQNVK